MRLVHTSRMVPLTVSVTSIATLSTKSCCRFLFLIVLLFTFARCTPPSSESHCFHADAHSDAHAAAIARAQARIKARAQARVATVVARPAHDGKTSHSHSQFVTSSSTASRSSSSPVLALPGPLFVLPAQY